MPRVEEESARERQPWESMPAGTLPLDFPTVLRYTPRMAKAITTIFSAPAKVNLSLRVLGKRPDGFHEVDILMARLDLEDELAFHNSRTTTLLCEAPGVPTDESNLVVKAVREFEKAYGRKAKQHITLTKRIPHGAGLGGGSADAAVTLRAVNEILGTGYDAEELAAMAAALGSDVPFFLHPVVSRCTGRGEVVTPVPELATWSRPIVLLKPQFGVATPTAYKALHDAHRLRGLPYGVQKLDGIRFVNDLEKPVFAKFPVLGMMKSWLLRRPGVRVAMMCGSGSTLFALTDTLEQARAVAEDALAELDPTLFTYCGMVNPQPEKVAEPETPEAEEAPVPAASAPAAPELELTLEEVSEVPAAQDTSADA